MRTAFIAALLAIATGVLMLFSVMVLDLGMGVPPQSGLPLTGVCLLSCAVVAASFKRGAWGRKRGPVLASRSAKSAARPAVRLQCAILIRSKSCAATPDEAAQERSASR